MEEDQFDSASIFGSGICEFCGRKGVHPECEAKAAEIERLFQEKRAQLLARHALHGRYGIVNEESMRSYEQAKLALERRLGRPLLNADRECAIEGKSWWYISESWIGCVGYIVEKDGGRSVEIGSGIGGEQYVTAYWSGIVAYVEGRLWLGPDGNEWWSPDGGPARRC